MITSVAVRWGAGSALALALDCVLASALAPPGSGVAYASRRDWTGSAACGACHPAELAAWQATPHARTRERFATSRPAARCLACHATGEAPAGPAIALEVGCEACHGAGAAYAEDDVMRDLPVARALGLIDLAAPGARAAVCAGCHRAGAATRAAAVDLAGPVHPTGGAAR